MFLLLAPFDISIGAIGMLIGLVYASVAWLLFGIGRKVGWIDAMPTIDMGEREHEQSGLMSCSVRDYLCHAFAPPAAGLRRDSGVSRSLTNRGARKMKSSVRLSGHPMNRVPVMLRRRAAELWR